MVIGLLSVCTQVRFSRSLSSKEPTKCLTLNNQLWQATPRLINTNSDETPFYPLTVSVTKCDGSCSTIVNLYTWVCVPSKVRKTWT